MTGAAIPIDGAAKGSGSSDVRHNDRSTIDFPYLDLDAGIEVAKAIYDHAGLGACEVDQLAAQMKQTVSGAFRMKTATAKTFGLVEKDSRSAFKLSPVGRKLVHPDSEAEGKAEAFLTVPLYREIYEKYKGHLLPPLKALEREMSSLGVAPKQADKARQAFERSARQAGFFAHGEDRLVQPRVERDPLTKRVSPGEQADGDPNDFSGGGGSGGGASSGSGGGSGGFEVLGLDQLLIAMLKKIPSEAEGWPKEKRVRWFRTFAMNVSQVYDEEDDPVDIEITLAKTNGGQGNA
ncbi:MAG: hypothetical protein HQL43_11895 [Alphaproteobacteria bacterium]|nr:hypothetical protein [Alphaproteobacteria bacterium]